MLKRAIFSCHFPTKNPSTTHIRANDSQQRYKSNLILKRIVFSTNCAGTKELQGLMPYIKINSKWITDLNVKPKTMTCLGERIGKKLCGLVLGKDFLDATPKAQLITGKNNKLDFFKMKNFCTLKDC